MSIQWMIRRNKLDMDIMRIKRIKESIFLWLRIISFMITSRTCVQFYYKESFIQYRNSDQNSPAITLNRFENNRSMKASQYIYISHIYRQWVYTDKIESVQYYCDIKFLLPFSIIWPFPFLTKHSVRIFWIAMFGKAT